MGLLKASCSQFQIRFTIEGQITKSKYLHSYMVSVKSWAWETDPFELDWPGRGCNESVNKWSLFVGPEFLIRQQVRVLVLCKPFYYVLTITVKLTCQFIYLKILYLAKRACQELINTQLILCQNGKNWSGTNTCHVKVVVFIGAAPTHVM